MDYKTKVLCVIGLLLPLIILEVWVISCQEPFRIKSLRMQLNIILAVVMFVCSRYIWNRFNILFHRRALFYNLGILFRILMFAFLVSSQFGIVCVFLLVQTDPPLLSCVATFSMGSVVLLTFCMIVTDICSFLYHKLSCKKTRSLNKADIKIRSLLSLISALILVVAGTKIANNLTVEHVTVPVKGLSHKLNGTTIVQISDIHLGPFNGKSRLNSIVDEVNQLQGDIVVITGDLVDSSVNSLREAVLPLKRLKTKHGAYFITGNHEFYTGDVDNWLAEIPKLNVTPLVNERVCLPVSHKSTCEEGLYLAGLEDLAARTMRYGAHSMDIHSALSGRTNGIPTIVLAHQPWAAAEAIMWSDVRLVLSGHTHAGQILPFMLFVYLYNPFYVGLYEPHPHVYVYVNPGTVYYLFPFRHYRPEITYITLISQ